MTFLKFSLNHDYGCSGLFNDGILGICGFQKSTVNDVVTVLRRHSFPIDMAD